MSYRAELANAARWASATVERLPELARPDLALEWRRLEDRLDCCRSEGAKELEIIAWRLELAERLAAGLLHVPLEDRRGGGARAGGVLASVISPASPPRRNPDPEEDHSDD